jgi:hypothetical protein
MKLDEAKRKGVAGNFRPQDEAELKRKALAIANQFFVSPDWSNPPVNANIR